MKTGISIVVAVLALVGLHYWWAAAEDRTLADIVTEVMQASAASKNPPTVAETVSDASSAQHVATVYTNPFTRTFSVHATQQAAYMVRYTAAGFTPSTLELRAGESVTFVNQSSRALRVTSAQQTTSNESAASFTAPSSLGHGGTFSYTFTEAGVWTYHDTNNPQYAGVVIVLPQE